jgi:hypothetical protein
MSSIPVFKLYNTPVINIIPRRMSLPTPSNEYLVALRSDLDRLDKGVRTADRHISLYHRLQASTTDPVKAAKLESDLRGITETREDFKSKYNLRVFQILLFGGRDFIGGGSIPRGVFASDANELTMESFARTDPVLLAGDKIYFG